MAAGSSYVSRIESYNYGGNMDEVIVNSVWQIAKAICKRKGFLSSPSKSDVEIVLEAAQKLDEALIRAAEAIKPPEQDVGSGPDD